MPPLDASTLITDQEGHTQIMTDPNSCRYLDPRVDSMFSFCISRKYIKNVLLQDMGLYVMQICSNYQNYEPDRKVIPLLDRRERRKIEILFSR